MKKSVFLLIFFSISFISFSQKFQLYGKITDKKSNYPLPFANVGIQGVPKGTASDFNGQYTLALDSGEYVIMFVSMGYETKLVKIVTGKQEKIKLDVVLEETSIQLNTLIITGSKYEQEMKYSISSVEVLKPGIIDSKNVTRVDDALEQIPGVTIIDNEPQIRAGSGFSSGMGSRVLMLLDEIPIVRADAGRPAWNFIPVEDIEQIEVVKGASSVVYGSSALNGVINIRTAYPKADNETKVKIYSGIYSKPERKYATSWDGFNPVIYGAEFKHARRFENFDLIVGGSYHNDPGFVGPIITKNKTELTYFDTTSRNDGEYDRRGRFNFGTRVRSKKIKNLSYGLNGNFMYSENSQVFFWRNSDSNMYNAFPGSLTNFKDFMYYLDPYLKYFGDKGSSHSLRNRYFYSHNDADNNQGTMSHYIFNEYQYNKKFDKLLDLMLTAGIMNTYSISTGKVFTGEIGALDDGTKTAQNIGVYLQFEQKLFKRLTYLIGGRWEYYRIEDFEANKPVFRAGLNLELTQATFVRASYGQGYRFPSIGERYIATTVGKFSFYPNPNLVPESSESYELGIKQFFQIFSFSGFLDIAGFYQYYENYIEFNAGMWGKDPNPSKNFGFRFLNTGKAKVYGIDFTLAGQIVFTKKISLNLMGGYTYSMPLSVNPGEVYFRDSVNGIAPRTYYNTSTNVDSNKQFLKYRIRHLGKLDVELVVANFSTGFSARYYSAMDNIDNLFYLLDVPGMLQTGYTAYREAHMGGTFLFDWRLSYELKKHIKFALIVNNILNKEYSPRPLKVESPRTTTLQISYKI